MLNQPIDKPSSELEQYATLVDMSGLSEEDKAVFPRLERAQSGMYEFPDTAETLRVLSGYDMQATDHRKLWWGFVFYPGSSPLALIDKYTKEPLPKGKLYNVDRVLVQTSEGSIRLSVDSWGNPATVEIQKKGLELEKINADFAEMLQKDLEVWEKATSAETTARDMYGLAVELIGQEKAEEINRTIDHIKQHPEIEDVNQLPLLLQAENIHALRKGESIQDILKRVGIGADTSFSKDYPDLYQHLILALRAWRMHPELLPQLLRSIQLVTRCGTFNLRVDLAWKLLPQTEKYFWANSIENELCKPVHSEQIFLRQKEKLQSAQSILKAMGHVWPEYCISSEPEEFSWAISVDKTLATAAMKFYRAIGISDDRISKYILHERLHIWQYNARSRGRKKAESKAKKNGVELGYSNYEEPYTEALAQLIEHNGSVQDYLDHLEEEKRRIAYAESVAELFQIILVVEARKVQPLAGLQLLMQGLSHVESGAVNHDFISPLRDAYNKVRNADELDFDSRMQKYGSERQIRMRWTPPTVESSDGMVEQWREFVETERNLFTFESLSGQEQGLLKPWLDTDEAIQEDIQTEVKIYIDDPLNILDMGIYQRSGFALRLMSRIESNPNLREFLKSLIDNKQKEYLKLLKQVQRQTEN